ncbi:MAG TPA: GyrI-like domain-containing protein, partial [Chloroflexota bacterium]|nr:GyrI-like domain-containing protein [Chloroflexota bacterium]
YTLKFARKKAGDDFKVGALRARWSGARLEADGSLSGPKDEWRGAWGLPIPDGIEEVPQKVQGTEVRPETWEYGTVAQILHIGPYATEPPTVRRLHDFIAAQGYEIAGEHEEEYLTRPTARVVKTLIRYPVRKRAAR